MTTEQFREGHQVELLQSGAEFFPALVRAIEGSAHEVRLETYIFNFDDSGEQVCMALERAALRGVRVFLVMDGIGTPSVPHVWVQRFGDAGVQWQRFSPLGVLGLLLPVAWRRLHRKLCMVDAHTVFCGGINILDDYVDPGLGALESPRFDFAVRIEGPLVSDVQRTMVHFWGRLLIAHQLEKLQFKAVRKVWKESRVAGHTASAPVSSNMVHAGIKAMLVLRDNLRNRNRIERAYRKAIAEAKEEVLIANAYFLPGAKLRRALLHAVQRGVRVRLLLQGRYEYFMQYHGARPVMGVLLAAGVEIHEYNAGFLHAKVAVIDGCWATVGSSNLDPLSLLLAHEANVVVRDAPFATKLRTCLIAAMDTHGVRLDAVTYAGRHWRHRLMDRIAFATMRLILFVTGRRY